mmetsp:Transcript_58755/g.124605  ORF Transcript_58755/g.124605 Transcript_58755/m.124605 type:complete len:548 (+) Transcript_58755:103-1746(+)
MGRPFPERLLRLLRLAASFFTALWTPVTCERHCPRVEDCESFLPSERDALSAFVYDWERASEPAPGEFEGRGIVMSGGPFHVLQALANLRVLRDVWQSQLPGEFWHAFELTAAHCQALKSLNVECKTLRNPGVFGIYGAIIPSILMSRFRHVIWLDTDVTPLIDPARLFDTPEYEKYGAIFWPDHWGSRCTKFGQSAWPNHVAWELLDIPYNRTDPMCIQEQETSIFLVDKDRHWKPLTLANYMLGRRFFTKVLSGCKDSFRLAWLKLGAKMFLVNRRPALLGLDGLEGKFLGPHMVHFWPRGELFDGEAAGPISVPIFVHQKKRPSPTLRHLLRFKLPFGGCPSMKIMQQVFSAGSPEMKVVHLPDVMPKIYDKLRTTDDAWNLGWAFGREILFADPNVGLDILMRSLSIDTHGQLPKDELEQVLEDERSTRARPDAHVTMLSSGWVGWWQILYDEPGQIMRSYRIFPNGNVSSVTYQGDYDGSGHGRLFRSNSRGYSHVLYGLHAEGKYELLRLEEQAGQYYLALEVWIGSTKITTGDGEKLPIP